MNLALLLLVPLALGPAKFDKNLTAREVFFGNPERTAPQLSPDGKHIAYLAPKAGVLNVWLAKNGDLTKAEPVTDDKVRGIRNFFWALDGKTLLYVQDKGG